MKRRMIIGLVGVACSLVVLLCIVAFYMSVSAFPTVLLGYACIMNVAGIMAMSFSARELELRLPAGQKYSGNPEESSASAGINVPREASAIRRVVWIFMAASWGLILAGLAISHAGRRWAPMVSLFLYICAPLTLNVASCVLSYRQVRDGPAMIEPDGTTVPPQAE